MRQLTLLCLFLLSATVGFAQWQFQTGSVGFTIKNAGLSVEGKFTQLQANINFNPENPEKSTLDATVNSESISTGINLRDKHLKKEEYFDVANFPKISLKLKSLSGNLKSGFEGIFQLTMKGITKEVSIPLTFEAKGKLSGNFNIDRRDFKVGGNSWTMGDNVKIQLTAQLQKV
jgi:polyisoprenoid-binding protein YceI